MEDTEVLVAIPRELAVELCRILDERVQGQINALRFSRTDWVRAQAQRHADIALALKTLFQNALDDQATR